ncbi:hypothetical protein SD71_07985 [Cohnella kolymensis]|uniref:SPOR domain-containing protein n=1 Tax=Cohnella kolymensis TaxID=1590652 RepID=A0ABR5A5S3_9BACL|nr:SPOR domain-containing protein [Cohnella kolymensis]KIL36404.1 hypothetical protein SD71_07985 [Cohnella kolymensis]
MEQKARMTFRFEPPKKPEPKPIERQRRSTAVQQQDKQDHGLSSEVQPQVAVDVFASWDTPFNDIHALEEMIRRSDPVALRPREQAPPVLNEVAEEKWSLTDGPEIELDAEPPAGWLRTGLAARNGPSWWRVFLSVTAAVATGALFGYMVLSLFTGEPLFPSRTGGVNEPPTQSSVQAAGGALPTAAVPAQDDAVTSTPNGEQAVSEIPGDVYYLLQYGVFRSEDSMHGAAQELDGKGLAAAADTNEGYRIYAGVAATRNEAELLAAQMSGTEVYIKPLEGEPVTISSTVHPQGLAGLMKSSGELIGLLTEFTAAGLQDNEPKALSSEHAASLQQAHRAWLQTTAAAEGLKGEAKEAGKSLIQALNSAVMSMTEYNRKPSRYHLWSAQTAIMKALIADRDMRIGLQPPVKP